VGRSAASPQGDEESPGRTGRSAAESADGGNLMEFVTENNRRYHQPRSPRSEGR